MKLDTIWVYQSELFSLQEVEKSTERFYNRQRRSTHFLTDCKTLEAL